MLSESEGDDDDEVMPLQSSSRANQASKKRIVSTPYLWSRLGSSDIDLCFVKIDDTPSRTASDSEEDEESELGEEEYEIEYIVDARFKVGKRSQTLEYLIHWKGYPKEERSWTPANQFDDDDPPVLAFYSKHPNKPRTGWKTKPIPGDLRSYFAVPDKSGKGKENVDTAATKKASQSELKKTSPAKIERVGKGKAKEAQEPPPAPTKPVKRRKVESDDEDFVIQADDKQFEVSDDESYQSDKSEEDEGGDDSLVSDGEEEVTGGC